MVGDGGGAPGRGGRDGAVSGEDGAGASSGAGGADPSGDGDDRARTVVHESGLNRLELLKGLRREGTSMDDLSDHRSMDVVVSLATTHKEAVRYTAALSTVITTTTRVLLQVHVGNDAAPRASRCIRKGNGSASDLLADTVAH